MIRHLQFILNQLVKKTELVSELHCYGTLPFFKHIFEMEAFPLCQHLFRLVVKSIVSRVPAVYTVRPM